MDVEKEIQALQADIHQLQRNQSSRRGPEGGKGPKGDTGDPGPMGKVSEAEVSAALHKVLNMDEVADALARRVDLEKIMRSVLKNVCSEAIRKS